MNNLTNLILPKIKTWENITGKDFWKQSEEERAPVIRQIVKEISDNICRRNEKC
ncbi:MAG: hypothetical protein ACTSPB_02135 [Candidatus Thorarchaeota archaeon]